MHPCRQRQRRWGNLRERATLPKLLVVWSCANTRRATDKVIDTVASAWRIRMARTPLTKCVEHVVTRGCGVKNCGSRGTWQTPTRGGGGEHSQKRRRRSGRRRKGPHHALCEFNSGERQCAQGVHVRPASLSRIRSEAILTHVSPPELMRTCPMPPQVCPA